ncbi:MAG: YcnI family protein [Rhizobiales bacterium]|nr:YcnI family protein [Hyphomicrobiales bacterium]MBN9010375.1 YcnI family protein [Hyphomicrobiales bacterium]
MRKTVLPAAVMLALATSAASAHITLETSEAVAGSSYKAVFRVPHGCEGSATVKITVKIPEGFIAAKPMPHAGWNLDIVKGRYAKAYDYYGSKLDQGVTEITWSGGNLPDDYYDEFILRGMLASDLPASDIYFPVVQECEKGVDRWIEIPEAGKPEPETPAPGVKVLPKQ